MKYTSSLCGRKYYFQREHSSPLDAYIHIHVYMLHKKWLLLEDTCKNTENICFLYVGKWSSFILNWLYCILKSGHIFHTEYDAIAHWMPLDKLFMPWLFVFSLAPLFSYNKVYVWSFFVVFGCAMGHAGP